MKEVKIIESSMLTPFEDSSLSDLNDIRGGKGICFNYHVDIVGDCLVVYCGVKIGCVEKA